TDTMWVTPNQFMYTIAVRDAQYAIPDTAETTPFNYQQRQIQENKRRQRLSDSLKNALIKQGYVVQPESIMETYSTDYDSRPYAILIITSTLDSLNLLYNVVKNSTIFFGNLTSRKSTSEESLQQQLLQHILTKAKIKASAIASMSKLTLGNILSVKETPGQLEGWVAYPPLSALETSVIPGWHTTLYPRRYLSDGDNEPEYKYQIKNTLTVRFAVYDGYKTP
ncbi:MAG TPA: hypothetical protein VHB48_03370, partial [Chitinophagaceae bacterium]|nr:hypothetical protein [Chitinophagaceae bacterium]